MSCVSITSDACLILKTCIFIVLDILLPTQKVFIAVILGPGQYNKWMIILQDPNNVNSKQSNGNGEMVFCYHNCFDLL